LLPKNQLKSSWKKFKNNLLSIFKDRPEFFTDRNEAEPEHCVGEEIEKVLGQLN
jgi:hypothetical protein